MTVAQQFQPGLISQTTLHFRAFLHMLQSTKSHAINIMEFRQIRDVTLKSNKIRKKYRNAYTLPSPTVWLGGCAAAPKLIAIIALDTGNGSRKGL
jgi:hypothetical protein